MYHHEQLPVPSVRKVGPCFLIVILSHQHSDVMFDGDRRVAVGSACAAI
jgi:hypothetical protein